MVLVVPVYEEAIAGVYLDPTAVIDADGTYLGGVSEDPSAPRRTRQGRPGSGKNTTLSPGIPVGRSLRRHLPKWASTRATSVTSPNVRGSGIEGRRRSSLTPRRPPRPSEYLWKLEQPAQAVANVLFMRAEQSGGRRVAMEHGRILREQLFLQPQG